MNIMKEPWDSFRKEHYRNLGETVAKRCSEKGFIGHYAEDAAQALQLVLDLIPDGAKVGVPGSVTIREIGAFDALERKGCTVVQHWDPSLTTSVAKAERLREEFLCDVLLSSTNALTHDGTLVNIDGTENRVAAMAWGTSKVILVAGINKIARNMEQALIKIRDGPRRSMPFVLPWTSLRESRVLCGLQSSQRACRAVLTMERAPFGREIHVIIVGNIWGSKSRGNPE
jgi:L-lactate utilization protein LutB